MGAVSRKACQFVTSREAECRAARSPEDLCAVPSQNPFAVQRQLCCLSDKLRNELLDLKGIEQATADDPLHAIRKT